MSKVSRQISKPVDETWLEEIHQQWVSTLDAIRDAIVVVDHADKIVRANRSFATLCGANIQNLIQSSIQDRLPWIVGSTGSIRVGQVAGPGGRMYDVRVQKDTLAEDGRLFVLADISDSCALEQAEKHYEQGNNSARIATIDALVHALGSKDPYTVEHSEQVANLSEQIARKMGFDSLEARGIYNGARVHDIGKISIPSGILNKPGRLAKVELNLIQMHCTTGHAIVKHMDFPWPVKEIILQHHERLDGSGYPAGLTKGQIHVAARIVAVADILEAMSSHRPYRPALGQDTAISELRSGRGITLDADAVDACIAILEEA